MSQSNEINFGPVFMRGRKPAQVTNKPNPNPTSNPSNPAPDQFNQIPRSNGGATTTTTLKLHQPPTLGSFSPASNPSSLPLPKSFSAAVSPGKETAENRPQINGTHNVWDPNLNTHPTRHHQSHLNGHHSPATDYSRESLLSLYSEHLASKLPPDLEINDPAISLEFVGPPLALIEMSDVEKELFAGPFNSEKRSAVNKTPHHSSHDHSIGTPLSPDGALHHGTTNGKLSVGGPVKFGKHNPNERFNNLGIQGGVLAGVASTSHSNARRRGDNEIDPPDNSRRPPRSEDPPTHLAPWNSNPRDRRLRESGSSADGKWKRGVSFEDKMQASQEKSGLNNLKYSVLDKMREKATASLDKPSKEVPDSFAPAAQTNDPPQADRQLLLHATSQASAQPRLSAEDTEATDDRQVSPSAPMKADLTNCANSSIHSQAPTGSTLTTESSSTQPSSTDLNPEDIAWQYRDPSGTVQGPFTAFQMQEWYKASFFRDDLLVKRVMDVAFETLETLILRVGDRDRPFLARPPPALPPNLPLPITHLHHLDGQVPTPNPLPPLPNSSLPDPAFGISPLNENSSFMDPSPLPSSTSAPGQPSTIPVSDPWHNMPSRGPSLPGTGPPPASAPLASGTGWNTTLPAFAHPTLLPNNNDLVINDGLIEFNMNMVNGLIPNSFISSDTLRFLHQVPHPAMSLAAANGYPFPLPPLPQPPNFGQIPNMPHLPNATGIDHMLAAQLHSRLMHAGYLFRPPASRGADGLEQPIERPSPDNLMPSSTKADPWQVSSQPLTEPSAVATNQNFNQPIPMAPNQTQSPLLAISTAGGTSEPLCSGEDDTTEPSDNYVAVPVSQAPHPPSLPGSSKAQAKPQPTPSVKSETELASSVVESIAPVVTSPPKNVGVTLEKDSVLSAQSTTHVPLVGSIVQSESSQSSSTIPKSSNLNASSKSTTGPEVSPRSDSSWQNVAHQSTAKPSSSTRTPVASAPSSATAASKTSSKIVVMSKSQKDEQERRAASIQKAQLQLKEAQAIERAAREASEAAAAASANTFNSPAPWLKEEKTTSNLSLLEIQSMEAKQSEKRRLAEKQAAANRALAEQALAAERTAKIAKEALPPTSNWASNASSPTKPNSMVTVWGSKEPETPTTNNGFKQSMKQIQEEEARKKALALQQQSRNANAPVANKAALGYASSVASNKPPAGGPWSVVGTKSKVVAPPVASVRPTTTLGNSPAAIPGTTTKVVGTGGTITSIKPASKNPGPTSMIGKSPTTKPPQPSTNVNSSNPSVNNSNSNNGNNQGDGPPPASPEFMKWLREALRGMNNVDDFVKMLLDFPINPDESVLEIVSDSVYAGSATLDGRRFAKEFNARRMADVASRMNSNNNKTGSASKITTHLTNNQGSIFNQANTKKGSSHLTGTATTMADAVKFQPPSRNDGWGFAVVGAKKKKK